ncbi:Gfo/Idh/MocA family oxidoreductase [Catellatospora sp. KI3]|uniref:Gfo/Idh/MocA family protein n=1 Tax=Catellatospora sp. KI3 TaxID=3041620 RepID=UPI0024824090|nr:Gfo/Idh/MocA family oxidoreductase [Catellatospora sp. KI3]MDI1465584.1 Gfo/Idh/MocA family oxidoreductase [Catellatospora sp. KI3]
MDRRSVGIVMNGVTGRMGYRQHLVRSILAIREQGGLTLPDGTVVWPEPVLVGRNAAKLEQLAEQHGLARYTTDLAEALADDSNEIYFDAQVTTARVAALRQAIAAGKHVYTEKPTAESLAEAVALAEEAKAAGIKHGVVADKLYLPGLLKLRRLVESGFFGRILSVRVEFGYWVFEGDWQAAQRPSWNYRSQDGGGIILDMFPHWRYVLDHVIAPVRSVYAQAATHIPTRWDEQGDAYPATADDAAYAVLELEGGIIASVNSSWTTRVDRTELVTFHVDGTEGSAVAGLRECRVQHRTTTPKPVWNPDLPVSHDFRDQWTTVPQNDVYDNGFKRQWEEFLAHVVADAPYHHDLYAGARGVQLAELGLQSAREGRKITVGDL